MITQALATLALNGLSLLINLLPDVSYDILAWLSEAHNQLVQNLSWAYWIFPVEQLLLGFSIVIGLEIIFLGIRTGMRVLRTSRILN